MQDRHWKPLISWVNRTFGVDVKVHESLLGLQQDSSSSRKLQDVVSRYDAFKLAGPSPPLRVCKSWWKLTLSLQRSSGPSIRPSRSSSRSPWSRAI